MIDDIFRNNLIIREWLNGSLFPLNLSLVIVIGLFLYRTWQSLEVKTWDRWHYAEGVRVACALWWIFLADATRAVVVWSLLWTTPRAPTDYGVSMVDELGLIFAGVVGLCATLRCCHLFSPAAWGHRYWIATLIVTVDFSVITQFVRHS